MSQSGKNLEHAEFIEDMEVNCIKQMACRSWQISLLSISSNKITFLD